MEPVTTAVVVASALRAVQLAYRWLRRCQYQCAKCFGAFRTYDAALDHVTKSHHTWTSPERSVKEWRP